MSLRVSVQICSPAPPGSSRPARLVCELSFAGYVNADSKPGRGNQCLRRKVKENYYALGFVISRQPSCEGRFILADPSRL